MLKTAKALCDYKDETDVAKQYSRLIQAHNETVENL